MSATSAARSVVSSRKRAAAARRRSRECCQSFTTSSIVWRRAICVTSVRDHTLQTTALVHEAYVRLAGQEDLGWKNRAHFRAIAATTMRRILIEHARSRGRKKRGEAPERVLLEDALAIAPSPGVDLQALDQALTRLDLLDRQQARIVELRFFADLSVEETAEVLSISKATVKRDWAMARAWLRRELEGRGLVP